MNSLAGRASLVFALWLIASLAVFQATLLYGLGPGAWFYVVCAACGALGLIIGKVDRVASLMAVPILAIATMALVSVLRLGYFGL